MEHIKKFKDFNKINETGEWSRDLDWEYVKNNPNDQDQEASWIRMLQDNLETVNNLLKEGIELVIEDIKGFDLYQGPYASIRIDHNNESSYFKAWTAEEGLFVENFPVNNTNENEINGFGGNVDAFAGAINNHC